MSLQSEFGYGIVTGTMDNGTEFRHFVDRNTGEVVRTEYKDSTWVAPGQKAVPVTPGKQKRKQRQVRYAKTYCRNVLQIYRVLTVSERAMLFLLLQLVGYENNFVCDPNTGEVLSETDIARFAGLSRPSAHTALQGLYDKGAISIVSTKGCANRYIVNPNLVLKGQGLIDVSQAQLFEECSFDPEAPVKHSQSANVKL